MDTNIYNIELACMKEMTSLERCLTVMNGGIADFIPVIPQSFMFALETAGFSNKDVNFSGKNMAKAHEISQAKYGYDGCIIDFDDATIAEAIGVTVIFRDDAPAIVDEHKPFWKDLRDVYNTPLPNLLTSGRICHWLEATSCLNSAIGNQVFIMGRADQGPFSIACLLRGTENFMMDLMIEDKQVIYDALDYCRRVVAQFGRLQKDAGAHITSMGDAFAGPNLISPEMYKEFAWEHEKNLIEEVSSYGIPFSLHICGDTNGIIKDMGETGAKLIEIDWKLDMKLAREVLPASTVLMGNVDPSFPLVLGTPREVEQAVKFVIEQTRGKGCFMSSGCAMGKNTPPENMTAFINATRAYGSYEQVMALQK